ncbi:MAG: hypothetical protein UHD64_03005 [Bacteroidales bacterium]|nr:hypothetical protein [Bacteroidales bacterium]
MVKITNGINVFEVTRGAFDGIYSRQGYTIFKENIASVEDAANIPVKTEDEKFLDEIIEKPISQWNKDEVKRFAALKEIDITGTKNANEAKEIIKSFIEADSQE